MNRFIGIILMVVAVAALAGAAIGWRFPFLGDNRSANQLNNSPEGTKTQPATSTKLATQQPVKQPASNLKSTQPDTTAQVPSSTTTSQAPSSTTTTEAPDATVNPEATQTAPSAASDANQPVPALW